MTCDVARSGIAFALQPPRCPPHSNYLAGVLKRPSPRRGRAYGTDRDQTSARPAGALKPAERHSVKVRVATSSGRGLFAAALVAAVMATALFSAPHDAGAITRERIIKRASKWVAKRVPYSQRGTYQGYRRDCSGFVSMAWKLDRSYTSRSISSVARRIPKSKLKPGDAVHTPGHIAIFAGWKDSKQRRFYAYEETTWGSHAKKRVRTWRSNARALRRKGIEEPRKSFKTSAIDVRYTRVA